MRPHVPEHVVVQHVLHHVHADLPIVTRLHFGMNPRKTIVDPGVRRMLSDCMAEHVNLFHSHERTFNVFAIPDEDFVGEALKTHVEAGERRAEWDAALTERFIKSI